MCKLKRSLVCKQQAHAGTDLDLNKAFPSFLATALKKTRSMCKQKRSLVCKQTAHAGTDLILLYFCLLWKIYGAFFYYQKEENIKQGQT